jgi:small ligand-binding sensory domain FIST
MPSSPAISTPQFAAALSTLEQAHAAAGEVCGAAMTQLGATPDFAVLFASPHHREEFGEIAQRVCQATNCQSLIGCTGESIVGGDREIEGEPAVSLWLASLPATTVNLMHLEFESTPDGGSFTGWPADLCEPWPDGAAMLLLGDPFSFPADELVRRMNEDRPACRCWAAWRRASTAGSSIPLVA